MKRFMLVIMFMFVVTFVYAQDVQVVASWVEPTEGSPVETYILELSENGGPYVAYGTTDQTTMELTLNNLSTYTARVSGQDSLGRQGPWSLPSEPYLADLGVPGQPGKPFIVE